jgi:hypothetical protein
MAELVPANPRRTGLWLQNVEDTTFSIYDKELFPFGGIYLYKTGFLYLTRDQDCHKQWWCKTVLAGAKSIRIVEFYAED